MRIDAYIIAFVFPLSNDEPSLKKQTAEDIIERYEYDNRTAGDLLTL
jgi:hypothetical protein